MRINIFHLTPCENAQKIMKEGINSDAEGNIFTFTNMLVANSIASKQVFTRRYTVLKIDHRGITGRLEKDNVAEFEAPFHRIIKQKHIEPKFLKLNEQVDKKFKLFKWMKEQEEKGVLSKEEIIKKANRRIRAIYRGHDSGQKGKN